MAPRACSGEGSSRHAASHHLGKAQLAKLKVYAYSEHPHAAQQPQPFEITRLRSVSA